MAALSCSLLMLAVVVVSHWVQPDELAWLTIWPRWLWLLPGGVVLLPGLVGRWRPAWAALLLWLATLFVVADETAGLLRMGSDPAHDLRIATLNCAGGQVEPIEALAAWQPDLVLLQEAPSARDCWTQVGKLYGPTGKAHWALETAILSRYRLTPQTENALVWSHLSVETPRGPLAVISLRLAPVPLCFNLLSSACRQGLNANRQLHRAQIAEVVDELRRVPETASVVVAGDFNAPAGDGIFGQFPPTFRDAWRQAGRGWGNTCVSDFPTSRIDQVWSRPPLRPVKVQTVTVPGSDHRAVIADLVWD